MKDIDMIIEADKNGFLTWNRNGVGGRTKIFCPFNKKMQCNYDCPFFVIEKGNIVKMLCKQPCTISYENTIVKCKGN